MKYFLFPLSLLALTAISPAHAQNTPQNVIASAPATGGVRFVPSASGDTFAAVLDERTVHLNAGRNVVNFSGVTLTREAASLQLNSDNPDVRVLEQATFSDSSEPILNRYLGQTLRLKREGEELSGKLLGLSPTLFQTDKGVLLDPNGIWILPDVPTTASLSQGVQWTIEAPAEGDYRLQLRYLTKALTWSARYLATLDAGGQKLDFSAWISIGNSSETSWKAASWSIPVVELTLRSPQPLDLEANQTRQIALLARNALPVTPSTVLSTSSSEFMKGSDGALQTALYFGNSAKNGLGLPLPPGPFVLWQQSPTGDPLLLARGNLSWVRPDETVTLPLGASSGLSYQRTIVERRLNPETRELSITITLNNAREQAATVAVDEDWPNPATFGESDPKPDEQNEDRARWKLTLPPNSKREIAYSLQVKN